MSVLHHVKRGRVALEEIQRRASGAVGDMEDVMRINEGFAYIMGGWGET